MILITTVLRNPRTGSTMTRALARDASEASGYAWAEPAEGTRFALDEARPLVARLADWRPVLVEASR